MCQPGYRYPPYQNGPFKGELIEKATKEEYSVNFDCIPVDLFQQVPLNIIESNTELISYYRKRRDVDVYSLGIPGISVNSVDSWESLSEGAKLALAAISSTQAPTLDANNNNPNGNDVLADALKSTSYFRELSNEHGARHESESPASSSSSSSKHSRVKRYSYQPTDRINSIFSSYEMLASDYGRRNCHLFGESERSLPGDTIYGVHTQFESQAKLALSISHFLSSFYQIINNEEDFPLRNAEKPISEDQMYAEVISAIAADFRVRLGQGIFVFFESNSSINIQSLIV